MVGDWKDGKTYLFKDDADRERFVGRLAERVGQYHIRLHLFVLMTNHLNPWLERLKRTGGCGDC